MTAIEKLPARLTQLQESGIRAMHAELERFCSSLIASGEILMGLEEIRVKLQLPVPSPIGGAHHIAFGAALEQAVRLMDAIQAEHYHVLYPSRGIERIREQIRAEEARAA